jgi:cytoskeletal protein RodZ
MDQQEPPSNVRALFPGIDTTPFGKASDTPPQQPPLSDDGWNTDVPERTITDDDGLADDTYQPEPDNEHQHGDPQRRRRLRALRPAASWIAVALLAGGALAAGREVLTPTSNPSSHASNSSSHALSSSRPRRPRRAYDASTPSSHPRERTRARHQPRHATRKPTRTATHRHPTRPTTGPTVRYTPAVGTPAASTPTTARVDSGAPASSQTPSQPVNASNATATAATRPAGSPRPASQPAGPTEFGHVVGSNCNPQCR